jgi:DNA polymerase III alpha subunit
MSAYIPLRVYTVFSQGEGTVDPGKLAEVLKKAGAGALAVCDPLSTFAWDRCAVEAGKHGLKPLFGVEVRFPEKGTLLLFPLGLEGYREVVGVLGRRAVPKLRDVAVVLLPSSPDPLWLKRMRAKAGPENTWLGLEWHSGKRMVERAREEKLPLVWANPLRWVGEERACRAAMAVFRHLPLEEAMRADLSLDGLIPAAAVRRRFGAAGAEAMENTRNLAGRAAFAFDRLEAPPGGEDGALDAELGRCLAGAGGKERERVRRELEVIRRLGFAPWFRIAAEIGAWCRKQGILFHLRGSGASSQVLFRLGLSRVDPLAHGLLFERFVNGLRDDLPDIDIDIDSSRRAEVFSWLSRRWPERVAFLSSHKFFGARSALYETARAAGHGPEEAHALTRDLPMFARPADLRGGGRGGLAPLYEAAAALDGVFRELSLHVGGVVFSTAPAAGVFPLQRSPEGFPQLSWDKDAVERLKIFKLDLLGVRGFEVVAPVALQGDPDPADAETWRAIASARTLGCFQIESPLARENLSRCRPATLDELAVALAIIRPGPARSGMKQAYQERRLPRHPLLAELFAGTRGALIYEEQISVLLHRLTGWSLEMAEKVRRELKQKRGGSRLDEFLARGRANGWSGADLEMFWNLAIDFSLYAFCQAHSTAYAWSAYLSAWCKTHRPVEFFCRLFNAGGGYHPLPVYIEEAKRCGVPVLGPDVNRSGVGFRPEGNGARCGLVFVRGLGPKGAARLLERRGAGYASLAELTGNGGVNERELAALLAVSALRPLGLDGLGEEERRRNWLERLGFLPSDG